MQQITSKISKPNTHVCGTFRITCVIKETEEYHQIFETM